MPRRRFRTWLADKLFPAFRGPMIDAYWDRLYNWESWATNDVDYWWDKPDAERLMAVSALWDSNPIAAFHGYRELADEGCVHALIWQGQCYSHGHGTKADFDAAYACYTRAMNEGSWIATRDIATLLYEHGHFEECEEHLEYAIQHDFIPAYYWLARYRIYRSETLTIFREVRPLLEHAAAEGHPGAKRYLAILMMLGIFGIREIPRGIRMMRESVKEVREYHEAS